MENPINGMIWGYPYSLETPRYVHHLIGGEWRHLPIEMLSIFQVWYIYPLVN